MDIKEIALKVGAQGLPIEGTAHKFCMMDFCSKEVLIEFAEALVAEIAKQNEPVESQYKGSDGSWKSFDSKDHESNTRNSGEWEVRDLFTYPPTAEQIAKAEQRVAESIAEFLESLAWRVKPVSANEAAIEIRSGEWRKFVKEA